MSKDEKPHEKFQEKPRTVKAPFSADDTDEGASVYASDKVAADAPAPKGKEAAPEGAAAAPKKKASAPGCTLCRVTGTSLKYHGRVIPEGTVAEFDDKTVLEMPDVLVSVE